MIVLDENLPESQRHLLRAWRIAARQIGYEVGRKGMTDDEIIPLLLRLRRPTFFTLDLGFYSRDLCHRRYCIVCMDVGQYETAAFVRRSLHYTDVDSEAKRMGAVIRIFHTGIAVWRLGAREETHFDWAH